MKTDIRVVRVLRGVLRGEPHVVSGMPAVVHGSLPILPVALWALLCRASIPVGILQSLATRAAQTKL